MKTGKDPATRIVVPYDFSEHSRAAAHTAADLARRLGGSLHLVHVIQPPTYAYGYGAYDSAAPPPIDLVNLRAGAEKSLAKELAELTDGMPGDHSVEVLEGMNVAGTLAKHADASDASLIVMGTHGRTGLAHVFLGSVAERTLRLAHCPVMTVKAEEDEDRDA